MKIRQSITGKFVLASVSVFVFFAIMTSLSFWFTGHIESDIKRVEMSSRQRISAVDLIHMTAHQATMKNGLHRKEILDGLLNDHIPAFEQNLLKIRAGDEKTGLESMEDLHHNRLISYWETLWATWQNSLKPHLQKTIKEIAAREQTGNLQQEETALIVKELIDRGSSYVESFDIFMMQLEDNYLAEMTAYKNLRLLFLLLVSFVFLVIVLYFKKTIIKPILDISRATEEFADGNLNQALQIANQDEIGLLADKFNSMRTTISATLEVNTRIIKQLNSLQTSTKRILANLEMETMLQEVAEEARSLVGAQYCAVGIKNQEGGYDHFVPAGLSLEQFEQMKERHGLPQGMGLLGHLFEGHEPILLDDIAKHKASIGFPAGHPPMKTLLGVPLLLADKTLGAIYLSEKENGQQFNEDDQQIISILADSASLALKNAYQLKEIIEQNQELGILNRVARITSESSNLDTMLKNILDEILNLGVLHIEKKGAFFLADDRNRLLHMKVHKNFKEELLTICQQVEYGHCLCGLVAEHQEPITCLTCMEDGNHVTTYPGIQEHGHIILPLKVGDVFLGVLCLYISPGEVNPRQYALLEACADIISLAISNAMHYQEIEARVAERTNELLQANNKLITAMRLAEAATQAKSEFLANMSHELRTPLNAIIGFSDIMSEGIAGDLSEEQNEYITDINKSGKHLLALINDILDLSKIEAGRITLEYTETEVQELIDETLFFVKEKAMKHGLKIMTEVSGELPDLEADRFRIKQVLVNLLSNAVKFTPNGGEITVKARMEAELPVDEEAGESQGPYLELSVEDTGIGIKPEDLDRLFIPFSQLEEGLSKTHQGTGLGLSICKQIIESHHGTIWVESKYGKGSRFIMSIPFRKGVELPREKYVKGDEPAGPASVIEPVTKLLTWNSFKNIMKRVISLHERKKYQFGILNLDFSPMPHFDYLLYLKDLQALLRPHDIIAHDRKSGSFNIVLLESDKEAVNKTYARIIDFQKEKIEGLAWKSALYPDNGKTLVELLQNMQNMPLADTGDGIIVEKLKE